MKILAVLQNMWVKDPERVKAMLARTPQARRRVIHFSLFAGCRTGRVLKSIFGEDRCREIVWEESTTEIASNPRDIFPPDIDHLKAVLAEIRPDVVLSFGRIASVALSQMVPAEKLIVGPHPTARQGDTLHRLRNMAARLDALCISSSCSTKEK
jgi:hypothetical protein